VHDNKVEILSKRNILCGHISNVLCYFGKRDPITKLSLLKAYCSSFYGTVLWDLDVPFGVKESDVSGAYRTPLTLPYCRRCVDCCR